MILIFDTSTNKLAIGIADNFGNLLGEFHAEAGADERGIHDARLAQETERLLNKIKINPKKIERIGLIIGPGSFTGLRIGLSFAKGLAFATGAAIVPLIQHEVIAVDPKVGETGSIVTHGYRDDLFYLANATTPRNVTLVTSSELPSSFTSVSPSISLETLARLTANAKEVISGLAIDLLEPLYITEFKANAGL